MEKKEIRINRLLNMIVSKGALSITNAAKQLDVSEMTVRRDLEVLKKENLVKNVNGVLVPADKRTELEVNKEYDLANEVIVCNEVKSRLGKFAAKMIRPGECIVFDIGSTTEQIARQLPPSTEFEALCFTLNVVEQLCRNPNVNVMLAGGYYHPDTQLFVSENGVGFIKNLRAHKVFLSASGIHPTLGISCINHYEVPIKRAILQYSMQHILVADSSKFGKIHSTYFCGLTEIDTVITDTGLPDKWKELLQSKGITVYLV